MTLVWKVKYINRNTGRKATRSFYDIVEANQFAKKTDESNRGSGYDFAVVKYALIP